MCNTDGIPLPPVHRLNIRQPGLRKRVVPGSAITLSWRSIARCALDSVMRLRYTLFCHRMYEPKKGVLVHVSLRTKHFMPILKRGTAILCIV